MPTGCLRMATTPGLRLRSAEPIWSMSDHFDCSRNLSKRDSVTRPPKRRLASLSSHHRGPDCQSPDISMEVETLYPLLTEAIRKAEVFEELSAPGARNA